MHACDGWTVACCPHKLLFLASDKTMASDDQWQLKHVCGTVKILHTYNMRALNNDYTVIVSPSRPHQYYLLAWGSCFHSCCA